MKSEQGHRGIKQFNSWNSRNNRANFLMEQYKDIGANFLMEQYKEIRAYRD